MMAGEDEEPEIDPNPDLGAAEEQGNLPGSDTGDPATDYTDTSADTSDEGFGEQD